MNLHCVDFSWSESRGKEFRVTQCLVVGTQLLYARLIFLKGECHAE